MPPQTFEELAGRHDYSINLNGANETPSAARFLSLKNRNVLINRINERVSKYSKLSETKSCLAETQVQEVRSVCVGTQTLLTRAALTELLTQKRQRLFRSSIDIFVPYFFVVTLSPDMGHIHDKICRRVFSLVESGLRARMQNAEGISEEVGKRRGEYRLRTGTLYPVEKENGKVKDVTKFGKSVAILKIVFMGCAGAMLVFIIELLVRRCAKAKLRILELLIIAVKWIEKCVRDLANLQANWEKQRIVYISYFSKKKCKLNCSTNH